MPPINQNLMLTRRGPAFSGSLICVHVQCLNTPIPQSEKLSLGAGEMAHHRGPGLDSQHPHGVLQPSTTPVP